MASMPKKVADRITKETAKYQAILKQAKDRDINESDTVTIIKDIMSDVFGFDKYSEITSEYAIKSVYCDLAVKIENHVKMLIEVKEINTDLKETHIRQAIGYGSSEGIEWIILTSGIKWCIYRIKFEKPIVSELVLEFSFLEINPRKQPDQEKLFLLCREGINRAAIEEFHEHKRIINKFTIGAILMGESCIDLIKRELKRLSRGIKPEKEEIIKLLVNDVLKREIVDGQDASDAAKKVRKSSAKPLRTKRKSNSSEEIPGQL